MYLNTDLDLPKTLIVPAGIPILQQFPPVNILHFLSFAPMSSNLPRLIMRFGAGKNVRLQRIDRFNDVYAGSVNLRVLYHVCYYYGNSKVYFHFFVLHI
jgi:hypothetical protein